jgi:hypothetical protein
MDQSSRLAVLMGRVWVVSVRRRCAIRMDRLDQPIGFVEHKFRRSALFGLAVVVLVVWLNQMLSCA